MAQYAWDCGDAKTVLVEHDLTFDLYRQLAATGGEWEMRQQAERWARYEPRVWRELDCVVTVSEQDRERVTARRVECLPNGVDTAYFRPTEKEPEPGRLLFIGSFGHLPNLVGLAFFLREVWPAVRDGSTLHILGGNRREEFRARWRHVVELDLNQPGIEVEGFVEDIRPAYARAELVIAPLEAAAGTNIKILEAMAMGKPVVTTPTGTTGLDVTPGKDIIEAASPKKFAAAIRELQRNPPRRLAIGKAARSTVERRYGWDRIAARQTSLYHGLTQ
ncbi:MAG: glycosyltransferase [bacterium]|nr:glycosyltransferase [bacterium]